MSTSFPCVRLPRLGALARAAGILSITLSIVACGGGGGGGGGNAAAPTLPDTVLIYGTAATGAAFNGTISIEDSAGKVVSLPVSAGTGTFSASVNGMTAPFMLKAASADGKTLLYSAAPEPGRANLTPLTTLEMMRIASTSSLRGPADLYDDPAHFTTRISSAALADAAPATLSRLMPAFIAGLPGASAVADGAPTYDPVATPWTVGDAVDQLLDAYPITFTVDGSGAMTATQTDRGANLSIEVVRSDTASVGATSLSLVGAGQGSLVGGSALQLGARATFSTGAQQTVAATWSVTGIDASSIDRNGRVNAPAVSTATPITITARWFDGAHVVEVTSSLTLVPTMRPLSLEIVGATDGDAIASGSNTALTASVHWSDGSVTTPAVTWTWSGDASAVTQLGTDGTLRTGRPSSDEDIDVDASFTQAGVAVSADISLTVAHFARRVTSATISGLAAGQTLTAGDHAALTLTAHWNDGSESTLTPSWSAGPALGQASNIALAVTPAGMLTTAAYFVPTSADASQRAPQPEIVTAIYDAGDGTGASVSTAFSVKPLLKIPTALSIHGASSLAEQTSATYDTWVVYADGSTEPTHATLTSQDPSLLALQSGTNFLAGHYDSQPAAAQSVQLVATQSYAYVDDDGQAATIALSAVADITITWVDPVLVSLSLPTDLAFVLPGHPTPVEVDGRYNRLGVFYATRPVPDAALSASSSAISVDGQQLNAAAAPTSPDQSWVLITATVTDSATSTSISTSRYVTVPLSATVPKQLLALPWEPYPYDLDVQFRAISSDGFADDYTVVRSWPENSGYDSNATRRHIALLSGVSDLAATGMVGGETGYLAAVEQGRVVVMCHARCQDVQPGPGSLPVLLPAGISAARSVALVVKADAGQSPSSNRLYVLDAAGVVSEYRLPYIVTGPLGASDVVFERKLPGTFVKISAGSEHLLALRSDGTVLAEGSNADGQIGDPTAGATGWHEAFEVQMQVLTQQGSTVSTTYQPLAGVTFMQADRMSSLAATPGYFQGWGPTEYVGYTLLGSIEITSDPSVAASRLYVTTGVPLGMINSAYVQADGSVIFLNYSFLQLDSVGANLGRPGDPRYSRVADWLPPVRQIVAGRLQPNAEYGAWPVEPDMTAIMPVLLTDSDAVLYLDGQAVNDSTGAPLVLP